MKAIKVNGYIRISMRNAEKRFENGETIFLCPFKLRPGEYWYPETAIAKNGFPLCDGRVYKANSSVFREAVDEFTHYNCNYSVGEYPAYYIKEGKK